MRFTAFRHAAYDTPWWAFPSSREGRFHRAGQDTVQYLSLHPLGPAAEMLRHHVGPGGDPDEVLLNLWTAVLDIEAVVTVDFQDCEAYGLTVDELVGDDYAPTQALAAVVRDGGADAMVVPSAALPGTSNLILFGVRVLHPYLWEPISAEEVPTGHLTDGARSATEIADRVRWLGTPHPAVEQWKTTDTYELFDDPMAARW
ncbi:RES family NAD+ phosphorylase [Mycolicibacterium pulveris]|uniref:RES domain-containing protein n=1 Tax=Mycolicibacterium pulveris TaxID=36813 RepID=A0A7I7US84_MYCPV|nr:RES family NAD+ phosphorylase [Mycolicibacterium pulveris]MCV6983579.1 RES family NAD+ phosphorylase [Mycolicibacterium pulveris]BBY83459.1 hypothetical protein MPUL_46170 [Mycolicibacterium pulveris]